MAQILTYLGKGGTGRTRVAIATAKHFARQGKRVLLVSLDSGPALGITLGLALGSEKSPAEMASAEPVPVEANFSVVQFRSTVLLQQAWEQLKQREAQYLRSPFFKNVYGEELGILPGMDGALAMNALREYAQSGRYDLIIYDSESSLEALRNLGSLEVTSWYVRRFKQVILESDIGMSLMPFLPPIAAAVLQNPWQGLGNSPAPGQVEPMQEALDLLEEGRSALNDPARMLVYLVTTGREEAIATARYLWGSAQQVGLTVGGVFLTQGAATDSDQTTGQLDAFSPLPMHVMPPYSGDWQPLINAIPSLAEGQAAPASIAIDVSQSQVRVFLPGFDKKQVKLTQYNQEVTIEAGDQRRNILLPEGLKGRSVTGAKFQDSYLVISF